MNIKYNAFGHIEPSNIYLCRPNQGRICSLNGIDETSFSYTENLQDFDTIEFRVNKYIDIDGEIKESTGYEALDYMMEILVDNIGRFVITSPPSVSNDGFMETKTISATSLEWNLMSKDLVDFKINTGEEASVERLIDNNTDALGRTLEYITIYKPEKPELSLLHILLTYIKGWSIGYIDPLIAVKTPYFNVSSTNIYAFMTQDMSKYLQCIFQFDTLNKKINIYGINEIGTDTNINISFRNLQKAVTIDPQTDDIYTRYTVRGNDDMDFSQVNFGDDQIEDISYYLTTNYVSQDIIDKYNAYTTYRESQREAYVNTMKSYIETLEARDEIINRVPTDSLSYDWNGFTLEQLNDEKEYFNGLVQCIEQDFTVNGVLDEDALKDSVYWWDYYSYITWIIPNIEIAISNYAVTEDDKTDYLGSWETEWELYGTNELQAKMTLYSEIMEAMKSYKNDWDLLSSEEQAKYVSKDTYAINHQNYLDAETNYNGAKDKYETLMAQVSLYDEALTSFNNQLQSITEDVSIKNSKFAFTQEELTIIDNLYRDTDYTNEYFSTNTYTTNVEKLDIQLELLEYAKEDLAKNSRPQYSFTSDMDNLYSLTEFKSWHDKFELGNFIRVYTSDTHAEKLRLISKTYNPMEYNSSALTIEFSNMLKWNNKRNDFTALFDDAMGSSSKNSISKGSSGSDSTEISNELIKYILNSRQMNDVMEKVSAQNITSNEAQLKTALINYLKADELDANVGNFIELNADRLFSDYAKLDYLVSNYVKASELDADIGNYITLNADSIFADYLKTSDLEANVANIDLANISGAFINSLQSMTNTAIESTVDTAFIKDAIVGKATINDLFTDSFTVGSDNAGTIEVDGSVMQFKDAEGDVYIQLGTDAEGGHALIVKDDNGTILLDGSGITEDAIADGLIVDSMVKRKDAAYSGISADALNIDSVVTGINNSTTTIKSSQIYFDEDNQTLNTKMTSLSNAVDEVSENLEANYYNKTETSDFINTTLSTSVITKSDGQVVNMFDAINEAIDTATEHSQTISSIETNMDNLQDQIDGVTQEAADAMTKATDVEAALINNYSTTTQVNSAIEQKSNEITLSVDSKITTTKEYADTVASQAEANAVADTANKLTSYSTTQEMNAAIDMAKDSITSEVSATYTTKADFENNEPFITGTQTTATGAWTGTAPFSELADGQKIVYWLPYSGSGNATLNLTLSDGTTTGALPCYYSGTTRLTTHYAAGNAIRLTYRKNVSINGSTALYTGWWSDANYDSGNTYDRTRYNGAIKASAAITAANIIVGNSSGFHHLKAGTAFDIGYPILYAASSITSGSTGTNNYIVYPLTITTTQSMTLTAHRAVYIKGVITGSTFTPVSTTPLTQTIPTAEDGYYYILLGTAYSSTAMYLLAEHPIFTFINGSFQQAVSISGEAFATASAAYSKATQTAEGFSWLVADDYSETNVKLSSTAYELAAQNITLSGEHIQLDGYTVITDDFQLNGNALIDGSVTASALAANTITTEKLNVADIFGDTAVLTTLTSQDAFIDAISTNSIVVGANSNATEALANANTALSTAKTANTNADTALSGANSSIKSITMHYLATNAGSGVTTATSGWTTTIQTVTSTKKYLWTYQTMTTVSGATSDTTPVISGVYGDTGAKGETGAKGATGAAGADGADGVGILSVAEYYAVSSSNSTAPTSWSTTVPTMTTTNKYLWNYEVTTYTDNTTSETAKRVIGAYGNTGAKGATGATGAAGADGADGVGILSVAEYYAVSSSNSTSPASWSTTVPTMTTTNKYLWNYEVTTYTDNTTSETAKRVIGAYGNTGAKGATGAAGADGADGNGISSITNYYLASASSSGVTTSTTGWTTTIQTITTDKKYLWNYEVVAYTDGTSYTSTPVIIGAYGNTGAKGADGADGADGVGILSVAEYYAVSSSNSTSPASWSTTVPTMTTTNKYLWNYEVTTYTDNTTSETAKRVIGAYGNTGAKGATGAAGAGITSVTPLYYLSSDTTAPSAPASAVTSTSTGTGVWTTAIPVYVNGYSYFTCTQTLYTNGTYKWSTVVIDSGLTSANDIASTANSNAASAINSITNWCYDNNTTYIDGGNIYAGTVSASQIAANAITTEKLATDSIKSANYAYTSGTFSTDGTFLDLSTGVIRSKNFTIDSDGDAYFNGIITAGSGSTIGGWTLTNTKIYAGDSDTGVAVMQMPTANTSTVFGAGGSSHNSYSDCKFLVLKDGTTYINTLYSSGNLYSEGNLYSSGNFVLKTNGKLIGLTSSTGETVAAFGMSSSDNIVVGNGNSDNSYPINIYGSPIRLQNDTNVYGSMAVNGNVRTFGIIPNVNGTYSLGDSSGFGWSNIYLGQASAGSSSPALRVITGSGAYFVAGLNYVENASYLTFGNNTYVTNIVGATATTSTVGESIRLLDSNNYSANSGSSPFVYLACGADATSTYIRSYPVYARTYSVSANMVVSATGFIGRYQSSSARYKHDINYLSNVENATQNGIDTQEIDQEDMLSLLKLPVCKFKYNEGYMTGEHDYDYDKYVTGFIAEDVAKICPECATYQRETVYTTDAEGNEVPEYERDTDVVEAWDANKMIPRLLYIIQYQEKRISNLEAKSKEE